MIVSGAAFTVFILGMRHGADPDHIAAIDNLTRNSFTSKPWLSRFCGALFAAGHSIMILCIAALVGLLGARFGGTYGALFERAGTWISILVLTAIAAVNIIALRNGATQMSGIKSRLVPAPLRNGTSPWLAVPVGLLFGFGFETSSQIATYTMAFGARGGLSGALVIGAAFCVGMIVTDTLDSIIVHRLVSDSVRLAASTARVWVWSVSLLALFVAAYELAQVLGWITASPTTDIYISASIVTALFAVFVFLLVSTRRTSRCPLPNEPIAP